MGMFDYVEGECICPKCKKKTKLSDQIKWSSNLMHHYHKGDAIDAKDGEYDYGSSVRPYLFSECDNCKDFIKFSIIVENGIIKEFHPLCVLNKNETAEIARRKKIAQKEYKKSSFIKCIASLEEYKSSIMIAIDKSMKDIELSEEYINEIEKSKNNIRNQINKLEDLLRKNIKENK